MHSHLVRLLFGIGAIILPVSLRADDAAPVSKKEAMPFAASAPAVKAPPPAAKAAPAPDSGVLVLPKVQVTARRIKELDRAIKKLDKAIAREKKKVKAGELDKVLNNSRLTEAASIFGGNSAAYLESVAASRVRLMETERDLLSDMKEPRSLEDLAMLQKELEKVRTMQRELDNAAH